MTAGEYIQFVVSADHWHHAKVIVWNKRGHHIVLEPHQDLPPDDEENNIFIRVDDTA